MAEWLSELAGGESEYKSVSLFCEIKLREIESMAGHTANPNRLRAAVTVALFDILLFQSGALSHALMPIRSEMLQCIYTREALDSTSLSWNTYEPPKMLSQVSTQATLEQLLGAQTYFARSRQLEEDLAMEKQLGADRVQQAKDSTRKRCEAEAAVNLKLSQLRTRCFYHWHFGTAVKKLKAMLAVGKKTSLETPVSLRDCFNALKRHADSRRRNRGHNHMTALIRQHEDEMQEMEARLKAEKARVRKLEAELASATAVIGRLETQRDEFRQLAQLRATEAEQQRAITRHCAALLGSAMDTTMRLVRDSVDEVESTPDAMLLRQMLKRRDVEPPKAARYQFQGKGYIEPWVEPDPEPPAEQEGADGAQQGGAADGSGPGDKDKDKNNDKLGAFVVGGTGGKPGNLKRGFSKFKGSSKALMSARRSHKRQGSRRSANAAVGGLAAATTAAAAAVGGAAAGSAGASLAAAGAGAPSMRSISASEASSPTARAAAAAAAISRASPDAGAAAGSSSGSGRGDAASAAAAGTAETKGEDAVHVSSLVPNDGGEGAAGAAAVGASVRGTSGGSGEGGGEAGVDGDGGEDGTAEGARPPTPPPIDHEMLKFVPDIATAQHALSHLPVDVVLMRWVNYHLSNAKLHGEEYGRRLHNFGSDMAGGQILGLVINQVSRGTSSSKSAAAQDPFRRCQLVVGELNKLSPPATDFLTADWLAEGNPELCLAAVARLFTTHHGLTRHADSLRPLHDSVRSLLREWTALSSAMTAAAISLGGEPGEPADVTVPSAATSVPEAVPVAELKAQVQAEAAAATATAAAGGGGDDDDDGADDAPGARGSRVSSAAAAASPTSPKRGGKSPKRKAAKQVPSQSTHASRPSMQGAHSAAKRRILSPAVVKKLEVAFSAYGSTLSGTTDYVCDEVRRSRGGMYLWRAMHARVVGHVWNLFRSRLLKRPEAVVDEREAKELREYTTVYPVTYRDLLDRYSVSQEHAMAQVEQVQMVLRKHRAPLSRIFQYYCASGDGVSISSMCLSEFWAFLRDSQIAHGGFGDKKSARLDLIFKKCNQRCGLEDEDEHNPDRELVPRQFVEALVRIGVLVHEKEMERVTLADALQDVLENKVVPHAIQSDTESWRAVLTSEAVRSVFQRHRLLLQRVFAYYCKADVVADVASKPSSGQTMNINNFLRLLRDCQAMDKTLTALATKHLFAHTQVEETFLDDKSLGGGEEEMIYAEFIEGLAAVALYKLCSPYVSIAKRIDTFIETYVEPKALQAGKKNRR